MELLGLINRLIDSKGPAKIWGKLWHLRGEIPSLAETSEVPKPFTVAMDNANKAKDIKLESILLSCLAELA